MQGVRQGLYRPAPFPFAAPHRRYTLDTIQSFAAAYLNRENSSYRRACLQDDRQIVYDDKTSPSSSLASRAAALSASTLWRWIAFLGDMPETSARMMRLVRQRCPASQLHRQIWLVSPSRYRSEQRKHVLQEAQKWLVVARTFLTTFADQSPPANIPNLATVLSWR